MRGRIFDIQRYSTGDGPGIRTTVFLKGCPLSCAWCHNPESQRIDTELLFDIRRCIGCQRCVKACPHGVHVFDQAVRHAVYHEKCIGCGTCVKVCPAGALTLSGKDQEAKEVVTIALKDRYYYGATGGLTISGGEPMVQLEFVNELVWLAKKEGLHVALDTSGAFSFSRGKEVLANVDLVLFDIKHMDTMEHQRLTGIGNEEILENFIRIQQAGIPTIVRVPVIAGYNDKSENIVKMREFLRPYQDIQVELLPYHKYGEFKYQELGRKELPDFLPPSAKQLAYMQRELKQTIVCNV